MEPYFTTMALNDNSSIYALQLETEKGTKNMLYGLQHIFNNSDFDQNRVLNS